ncbi:hypothetical protein EVAR_51177_1 [Eumeta japonica]|uniref:Uncharacterized protein n=1 Tax=Eumeta variegata TaxID=151549 RepID=A0A4C1XFR8_EUMVA|nr:hypothetical protein EVAR_51177_1 [Eumeta japonica]
MRYQLRLMVPFAPRLSAVPATCSTARSTQIIGLSRDRRRARSLCARAFCPPGRVDGLEYGRTLGYMRIEVTLTLTNGNK